MTSREPLALLPGLLCDAALWRHQVDALSDIADCRVADFTTQSSIAAMAESVLAAVPEERFSLAGLSMGGYVALEVTLRAPDRVRRLALLDSRATPDTTEETQRRRGLIELAEMGRFKGVTPRLLPLLIHEGRLGDPALTGEVLGMAERIGKTAFVNQQRAIMRRPDSRADLAAIACPTLLLCGRQDVLTPLACHEEMAAVIPGSRLVVIEDCGHLSSLERPTEVSAALRDWLTVA